MNDSVLLRRLKERQPEAVDLLFEQYLPSVWRLVCSRIGGDVHLAEDLVNETMLALLRAIDNESSAEIQSLGGWLHTVAIRKVHDHYRAAARVKHLVDKAAEQKTLGDQSGSDPSESQSRQERRKQIRDCMESLPANYRIALEWKYIEDLSVSEIADRMELTERAAESLLYRARKAFRDRASIRQLVDSNQQPEAKADSSRDEDGRSISMPVVHRGLFGGQAE